METPITNKSVAKRKKGLTQKLVISMLLVGALPLLIGLLLAFYQGTQSIKEVNGASFQALATQTARKLDLVVSDELAKTSLLATDVNLIQELENRRDDLSEIGQTALHPPASSQAGSTAADSLQSRAAANASQAAA